jgi:carnitine-CoA ligase
MNDTSADPLIIANLIARHAAEHPDLDVLTFVEVLNDGSFSDESRTYAELWHNGQCVAHALDAEDMQLGDAFAVVMQNHPEFVDTMVGSSIAGTVFVPIDPRTRGQKLAFMINHADCRGVVVGDYAFANVVDIVSECPQLEWIWVVQSGGELSTEGAALRVRSFSDVLAAAGGPDIAVRVSDPDTPMQMLYTSGTTGDPKAILSPYARFGFVASLGETLGLIAGDRPYSGLSLTHANAQLITLGTTLQMGLRGVFSRKFTKSRLWDITREYGCTTFNLLGGMTTAIYSEPLLDNDADNPVRFVLSAGMPAAIWQDFGKRFDIDIYEFYGAAEGGLTLNPPTSGPIGSIGKPPAGVIGRVVDEHDHEVDAGEPGEIVFQNQDGSCPVISYFKNPKASTDKTADGWLRMGDIGYRDADGWFYFLYRKGGGIRHNGDFVNPAFVEKELAEHPQVDDVFVYGVASANGVPGEKDVVAAIVLRDASGFESADVFRWCRSKLESSFVPTYLQIVDEIPKTASEKPQERFLLEAFAPDADNVATEQ